MATPDGRASDSCCQIAHRMGYWAVGGGVALGGGVHGLLFCGLKCLARHVPLVRGSGALDKASYMAMPALSARGSSAKPSPLFGVSTNCGFIVHIILCSR